MTVRQPFIKRGTRSNATARRLIAASTRPAPHILRATICDEMLDQSVQCTEATTSMHVGNVTLIPGQHYCKVESKFYGYYYVVTLNKENTWQFSGEEALATTYIEMAKAYCAELWWHRAS